MAGASTAIAGKLATPSNRAASRDLALAAMNEAFEKRPGGQHYGTSAQSLAIRSQNARRSPVREDQVLGSTFADFQICGGFQGKHHRLAIKLAIGLRARPAHRRALALVEHAKLDAGSIGNAAHKPISGVDLAHQMALTDPANGRIAGHLSQRGALVGKKQGARAEHAPPLLPLAARMASADDNDIVSAHRALNRGLQPRGQGDVSRETSLPNAKILEYRAKHLFDVNSAHDAPRARSANRKSSAKNSGSRAFDARSSAAIASTSALRWRGRVNIGPSPGASRRSLAAAVIAAITSSKPSPVFSESLNPQCASGQCRSALFHTVSNDLLTTLFVSSPNGSGALPSKSSKIKSAASARRSARRTPSASTPSCDSCSPAVSARITA